MSDVAEAPTQDAIAESLLPEPEQQTAEAPEAEQQIEEQVQEQPVEQEQQEQVEETAEDWLPTEQDKVFPDEVLQRYATRYGLDEAWQANPQLKQLVIDKINSDIYLQQLQQQQEEQPEPEPQPEPTREAPLSREAYFQNLTRVVQERTDPEVAKAFHSEFMALWQLPPEQQPMALTQTMSKYALNLMNTFIDDMLGARLQQQVSQAYPGFGDMYERSAHAMAWDRVRNSNSQFAGLPAYGSKDFTQKLHEAADRFPEIAEMIDEASGKPINQAQVSRWYTLLARNMSGQNVDPALLQRAAAAGAKNARRAEVRRSAGNLGSGQSKAASGGTKTSSQFQTNEDIFDPETMEVWQREHGRI